MAVYVPVANTVQANLRQTLGGQNIMNTLCFEYGTQPTVANMTALGEALAAWWENSMRPSLVADLSLLEVYLTDLTSQIGATVTVTTGLPGFGAVGQESMSNNVAACISFKTAFRGRSFQGRNYIGGIPIGSVIHNVINLDFRTAIVTAYDEFDAWSGTLGATHVVVSRYSGYTVVGGKKIPTPRAAGITSEVLTYKFTNEYVRTQRDRLP